MRLGVFLHLLGFFIFPTSNAHKTAFYLLVFLPVLLLIPAFCWSKSLASRYYVGVTLFVVYLWLTQFWSCCQGTNEVMFYSKRLAYIAALFIAVRLVVRRYPEFDKYALIGFFALGVISASVELLDYFSKGQLDKILIPDRDRFANQNRAARVYGVAVLVGLSGFFFFRVKLAVLAAIAAVVSAGLLVVLTRSAGALAALLVAVVVMPLLFRSHVYAIKYAALFIVACLVFFAFGPQEWFLSDGFSRRDAIWLSVLSELPADLWFGQGVRQDTSVIAGGHVYGHEHNIVLAVLRYGGVVGAGLMALVLCCAAVITFTAKSPYARLWLLLLGYGCLTLMSSGQYPLSRPNESWLMFWLPLAFIYSHAKNFREAS